MHGDKNTWKKENDRNYVKFTLTIKNQQIGRIKFPVC